MAVATSGLYLGVNVGTVLGVSACTSIQRRILSDVSYVNHLEGVNRETVLDSYDEGFKYSHGLSSSTLISIGHLTWKNFARLFHFSNCGNSSHRGTLDSRVMWYVAHPVLHAWYSVKFLYTTWSRNRSESLSTNSLMTYYYAPCVALSAKLIKLSPISFERAWKHNWVYLS